MPNFHWHHFCTFLFVLFFFLPEKRALSRPKKRGLLPEKSGDRVTCYIVFSAPLTVTVILKAVVTLAGPHSVFAPPHPQCDNKCCVCPLSTQGIALFTQQVLLLEFQLNHSFGIMVHQMDQSTDTAQVTEDLVKDRVQYFFSLSESVHEATRCVHFPNL